MPPMSGDPACLSSQAGRGPAERSGSEFYLYPPGLLEFEGQRNSGPVRDRLSQFHQHQMVAAGRELHSLAGRNLDPTYDRAHLHYAVGHLHQVDFDPACGGGRSAEDSISRVALIAERQITSADFRSRRRGACPGMTDGDVPGSKVMGDGGNSGQGYARREDAG